jgi:hypothetical protein
MEPNEKGRYVDCDFKSFSAHDSRLCIFYSMLADKKKVEPPKNAGDLF